MSKIGILYNKNDLKGLALAEQLNSEFKDDNVEVVKLSVDKMQQQKFDFDSLYIEEKTGKMFNKTIMFKLFNDKVNCNTFIFNEDGRKKYI